MRSRTPDPPALPGYDYVALVGQGGAADVFLYQQHFPKRRVAVKVYLEAVGEYGRVDFTAEVEIMAKVSTHPFIVTIYTAGILPDGRPYIVMEYCPGLSFQQRYKGGPLHVAEALRTTIKMAGALETLHRVGILHGDIKPANILTNDYGRPVLIDFNASQTWDAVALKPFGVSIPWAPPEALSDPPHVGVRSDVYSLSATLFTLLEGTSPFEVRGSENRIVDLLDRISKGRRAEIGMGAVSRDLAAVIYRGMALDPDDRFSSAIELAHALQKEEVKSGFAATPFDVMEESGRAVTDYSVDDATQIRPRRPEEPEKSERPSKSAAIDEGAPIKIFVVHGHDLRFRKEVVAFVHASTGIRPTVLSEEPNKGLTILEKFEVHAEKSSVAVVLLTADDRGGPVGMGNQPRARQNVIFEMGYFVGFLGRSRVIPLNAGVEKPSDIDGLLYIPIDKSWKRLLQRELLALGLRKPDR